MRFSSRRILFYLLHGNNSKPRQHRTTTGRLFSAQTPRMSSSGALTALFTATVSESPRRGVEPEDAKGKRHHLKNGAGFTNPWPSWKEMDVPKILWAMIKCVLELALHQPTGFLMCLM